ncbi:hypothetical protein SAMN05444274_102364 [Mariniphaga anaerophila]|uniref:Spermatogenesis-associated protein 20-like TRX domain-containing protein n=1 Tax=Mariniphaga anaerophila TaxID=1484053 RepID=A0A1M4W8Q5_9BACT|nr:thioredoxin domain-containing protein [Mariniphaga anaerophila]SHE77624.1 hypothetical protein SAMN05444274_102364 [Mariniphaga anaerophila]
MKESHTNALVHSSSPYLLQHAHNPVDWQPWSEELIENAAKENKLLLVSIGYAACHWCHVMAHESFEDETVAAAMNREFVCIKVDREERPDVDQYYMTAVHLMGLQGGWPLNVIALPDGKPVWGGTYFPKETWVDTILSVARFWKENPDKTREYAENLQQGISGSLLPSNADNIIPATQQMIARSVENWKERFDLENGGRQGFPKFPMPGNLEFLLFFGFVKRDRQVLDFVKLSLLKMARGGIYDQLGGGFARYSVDEKWKVPHFEKMLYDNGQLISIYSKAYQYFKCDEFKTIVYETAQFLERELTDESGAFYSSLDADSDGGEGKFYVWKSGELREILKEDFELFSEYFNVNAKGFWETGNYILLRETGMEEFARKKGFTYSEFEQKVAAWKKLLMKQRSERERPGLDDKTLASWNALAITGLADAYKAFGDERFKTQALQNACFIRENMMKEGGNLFHLWKKGKSTIAGFLEDYALVARAFISLFEISGDREWLDCAGQILEYSVNHFYDESSGLFYFSAKNSNAVVSNSFQNEDNVIPAANSVMSNNLHAFGLLTGNAEYLVMAKKMLHHVTPLFPKYPQAFANWGTLMLKITEPFYEVVLSGANAYEKFLELQEGFLPHAICAFAKEESNLLLFDGRFVPGKTLIYVCSEGTCRLPVENVKDARNLLNGEHEKG